MTTTNKNSHILSNVGIGSYICLMQDYLSQAVNEAIAKAKALKRAKKDEIQAQYELEHNQCSHSYWERTFDTKDAAQTLMFDASEAVSNAIDRAAEEELTAES